MRSLVLLPLILFASASAAQGPARTVEVRLSNFDFSPKVIHLEAGQPVTLRLVSAKGHHNFSAPAFFAAATHVSGPVRKGKVEVHDSVDVRLTPARGSYRLRCTHAFHTVFGMTGRIVVD